MCLVFNFSLGEPDSKQNNLERIPYNLRRFAGKTTGRIYFIRVQKTPGAILWRFRDIFSFLSLATNEMRRSRPSPTAQQVPPNNSASEAAEHFAHA